MFYGNSNIQEKKVLGLEIKMWVPLIPPCTFDNPCNCLKFSITTFNYGLVGQNIDFLKVILTTSTNSCNTKKIVDLPIANNSLQTKKLTPWTTL
jgi:hypothetical protein